MLLVILIFVCVAAFLYGIYLGLPGTYERDLDEIEEALSDSTRTSHRVRRRKTLVSFLGRKVAQRGSERRRNEQKRGPFQLR